MSHKIDDTSDDDKNSNDNNLLKKLDEDIDTKGIKAASSKVQMERELELKRRQLPNVPQSKRLRPSDINRIVRHTDNSIFDEKKCSLWTGYITNLRNKRKGTYINFYFKDKKKVALHRLLYANFKGEISNSDYIKYSCVNKGRCCNIHHMVRFEYNSLDGEYDPDELSNDNNSLDSNDSNDNDSNDSNDSLDNLDNQDNQDNQDNHTILDDSMNIVTNDTMDNENPKIEPEIISMN